MACVILLCRVCDKWGFGVAIASCWMGLKLAASIGMGFRPCGASHFFLLRQEKVSKKKATLGRCRRCRFPALLERPGGCGTRGFAPQTVLADCPRPSCVARHLSWGPVKRSALGLGCLNTRFHFWPFFLVDRGNLFFGAKRLNVDAFGVPVEGAEQRRLAGGLRLALSEPQASLASCPACRVAQGTRRAPPPGSPSFWLLFLGEARKSTPASKAEPQAN